MMAGGVTRDQTTRRLVDWQHARCARAVDDRRAGCSMRAGLSRLLLIRDSAGKINSQSRKLSCECRKAIVLYAHVCQLRAYS